MDRMMGRLWDFAEAMRLPDRPYGHFRWSCSALDEHSTMASYMALYGYNTLSRLGFRPPLSRGELEEWRETVESWFDAETGLIVDPLPLKRVGTSSEYESLYFTYTGRWLDRLRDAGVPGRFTVPRKTLEEHDVFASVDETRDWLESHRQASNPWGWGSRAGQHLRLHQRLLAEDGTEDGVYDFAREWFDRNQSPGTGLWGPPHTPLHDAVAGYYKIVRAMYLPYGWSLQHVNPAIDSALRLQDAKGSFGPGPCENFDALYLLYVLARETGYRRDDIRTTAAHNVLEVQRYWHDDESGFSSYRGCALTGVGGLPGLTPPDSDEADMYALAHWPWALVYMRAILLGEDPEPKPEGERK